MEIFELQGEYMRKMSDEEFYRFCRDNPDLKIERSANGNIEIMSPTGSYSGRVNLKIVQKLANWYDSYGKGEASGPDAGVYLTKRGYTKP